MSDPEKPTFQVVDRRRSAQQETTAASSAGAVPADTSSPAANAAFAAPPPVPNSIETTIENTIETQTAGQSSAFQTPAADVQNTPHAGAGDPDANDDMTMPDPAALLSYVAMQMDVKSLAATLMGVFAGQAWRAMGLVANPVTGQQDKNLPEAQTAIDCVQFLLGRVESDLSEPDRREMQRRLNDLRLNYITQMRDSSPQ